jgi:hypothetical protein
MDYKTPDEIVDLSFDFSANLGDTETLTTASMEVFVKKGVDAAPNDMLSGTASVVGDVVYQRIKDGIDKNVYIFKCLADTSIGRRLELDAFLPVVEIAK